MIIELYNALREANISEEMARLASEAVERKNIDSSLQMRNSLIMESMVPIEKEQIGIQADLKSVSLEIQNLAKLIQHSEIQWEKRFIEQNDQWEKRFDHLSELIRQTNDTMKLGFAHAERQNQQTNETMKLGFAHAEKQNQQTNETMKLGFNEIGKRLAFHERLHYIVITFYFGLLAKLLFF